MMGQFDLLGYCPNVGETGQHAIRRIISAVLGRDYEEKWIRYQHKTTYSVYHSVYDAILPDNSKLRSHSRAFYSYVTLDELAQFLGIVDPRSMRLDFQDRIMCVYHVTEICYRLEMERDGGEDHSGSDSSSLWKQNMEVSKALSYYMMYLLIMQPSLLPNVGSRRRLEDTLQDPPSVMRNAPDVIKVCDIEQEWTDGIHVAVRLLKEKEKPKRWEIIKLLWWKILQDATKGAIGFGQKNGHFQHLRQGDELLNFIWFCCSPYQER